MWAYLDRHSHATREQHGYFAEVFSSRPSLLPETPERVRVGSHLSRTAGCGAVVYSIGLIGASLGSVVSVERSRELLQTLESKIEEDEGNLDKFLSILD